MWLVLLAWVALLSLGTLRAQTPAPTLTLTPQEKAYIAGRAPVSIGVVVGNEPFAVLRNGQAVGYSLDVLHEIESLTGLRFDIRMGNWSEVYHSFRAGRLDALDAISHTPEREAFTRFTAPYYIRETALFENADRPLRASHGVQTLPAGTRIGVVRDIFYLPRIRASSTVELVEYPNYVDLVKSLAFGWLDGAILGRMTGDYLARELNLPNVQAAGPLGLKGLDTEDFRIGLQRNQPELHRILDKAIAAIPAQTYQLLAQRWGRYRGAAPTAPTPLTLSPAQRDFVARHPVIRVGTLVDYEPFSFVSRTEPKGFSVALADKLAERIGVRIEPVLDTWGRLLERFERGEIDVISNISMTAERAAFTRFTPPYYHIPNVVFVRSGSDRWAGLASLHGKRVGVVRGVYYQPLLAQALGAGSLVEFEGHDQLMRALSFGQVGAAVTALNTGNNHIRKLGLSNIEIAGELQLDGVQHEDLRFGIAKGLPELHELFEQALASLPVETLTELENRWLSARPQSQTPPRIRWTDAQLDYLNRKGVLRLCAVPDTLPYSALGSDAHHTGMLADLLDTLAQRGGISLRLEPARNWAEAVALTQQGRCDVLAPAMDTPAGRTSLLFTTALVKAPAVIATRMQDPFIEHLHARLSGPLGVVRGHPAAQRLRDAQPDIRLVEVDSDAAGLEMTRRGELAGHIGSMAAVAHLLLKNRWSDLKIGGRLPEDWRYGLATPLQDPALHAILQQLVDSIDPHEQQRIIDRWLAMRHEPGLDAHRVWQGLAVLVALLIGAYLWNTRLRQLNLQLAQANARLLDLTLRDPLTGLYNRKYLRERVSDAFGLCQRQGLTFAVAMIDIDHFKSINDRYGHVFGDVCLQKMAAVLSDHFQRQCDFALRYGGEEFAVVITAEQPGKIHDHLQRLRSAVQALHLSDPKNPTLTVQFTISVGCCCVVPRPQDRHEEVLLAADAALYRAKNEGRNRVCMVQTPNEAAPAIPAHAKTSKTVAQDDRPTGTQG